MKCKLCECNNVKKIYYGKIRDGGLGKYTKEDVPIYKCENCEVIWHDNIIKDNSQYYESVQYRNSLEDSSNIKQFYELHDKESLAKFTYTGTDIFRNKTVADIGCGGGSFLDFLCGVAKELIAIEPSAEYRKALEKKGYHTYSYAGVAKSTWKEKVDVVVSFDVIEHVDSPSDFIRDIYELLGTEGRAIIGTPTDAPIMRQLLSDVYEKKLLYSTQHLWILSEKSLKLLAENAGFKEIDIRFYQRYGINNLLGWLNEKEPCGEPDYIFTTDTLNEVWKQECNKMRLSDYLVIDLKK